MKQQIFFWAENLTFLRKRKKLSQETLAEALNIKRVKLASHEKGNTKNPSVDDLLNVSNFFGISIDMLLKVDLSKLGELKLRELEVGNDVRTKVNTLAITVDARNRENVEYVPVKAKAGYRAGYSDPEFIASLPRLSLPNLPKGRTFRMFPTIGDSMLVADGSDVLASYIEHWENIRPQTACIVILKGEHDFVFKLVTMQEKNRQILLESLNESYQPYTVDIDDVLEIWQFYSYQSRELPEVPTEAENTTDMLHKILAEVKALGKK